MARTKGSTNKEPQRVPETVQLTTEQRLEFLANLITDRILEDQNKGQHLLRNIRSSNVPRTTTTA
jgi:hypothetical protein